MLGAIQIIRDTLGGRGGSKNVTQQFLLVVLLVKNVTKGGGGGGGGLKSAEKVSRIIWMAPYQLLIAVRFVVPISLKLE